MNGEKKCIKIDITPSQPLQKSNSRCTWIQNVWKFAKEDTNRVKFALKVGLAVFLASLLVLIREPYEVFGATNIIWAILTVAIMFEYNVGTTFNKGFNRAIGSLSAGILAMAMIQVAMSSGHVAEPYIIGFSIFFVALATSFMRLWPTLTKYEYGFRVTLFTYCMIIITSYRMGNPVKIVFDRLYSIAIGAIIAVLVNVLIFPVWAGDQLHKDLSRSFTLVADALEECARNYLGNEDKSERREFSVIDEPAFQKCRGMMNSSVKLDSMANSAKWEPPHGRFNQFSYPWPKYVRVGAVLRYCAYEVMAMHGCLHSEIQAPFHLRVAFQSEILDTTTAAAELLRHLGDNLDNMKHGASTLTTMLKRVYASTERLQRSIDMHSHILITTVEVDGGTKRQHRRLYTWPSREVDEFESDGGGGEGMIVRMQTLETTATALSLATFVSLLIEFVARMDHLVDAVDELAKMAKFGQEGKN